VPTTQHNRNEAGNVRIVSPDQAHNFGDDRVTGETAHVTLEGCVVIPMQILETPEPIRRPPPKEQS
jgi:hypothetical protein